MLACLGCTERSVRLASMSTPRSANDVEGAGTTASEGYGVSVSSCDLHALMAMNRATPKYQATGVSSGQEAHHYHRLC